MSKAATVFWGIAQIVVALGAQFVDRSVLDAGLLVLSFAAGPVLGAFLVGVLTARVGSAAMVTGMVAGIAAVTLMWLTGVFAWTWFSAAGALVTGVGALGASLFNRRTPRSVEA